MLFERFLIYSMHTNRPVKVLLSGEQMKYVNLTVISIQNDCFVALKKGKKAPFTVPYDQVLAVSYARGDNGDTTKEFYESRKGGSFHD